MVSRRQWQLAVLSTVVSVALLAACGGGGSSGGPNGPVGAPTEPGSFARVVVFGDSLSDLGTYAPATSLNNPPDGQPPYFGGRFTTNAYSGYTADDNTSTAAVWPELVANVLGLRPITPNQIGFAGQSLFCPAALASPTLADTCTGYAQGGARVTDPNGIGKSAGALTVPMVTQVNNHLTRFGNFTASDLVFVYGGNNDVLTQYNDYLTIAAELQARVDAGELTAENRETLLTFLREGALANIGNVGTPEIPGVARQLATLIKSEIIAKGGRYVAVMSLPDIALTPFGRAQSPENQLFLTSLSATFNAALAIELAGVPVRLIDASAIAAAFVNNPATYGLANVTIPACDAAKIATVTSGQVTDGSSLFCNSTPGAPFNGLRDGADVNTWLFADGVHPTVRGHLLFATSVLATLQELNWIAP